MTAVISMNILDYASLPRGRTDSNQINSRGEYLRDRLFHYGNLCRYKVTRRSGARAGRDFYCKLVLTLRVRSDQDTERINGEFNAGRNYPLVWPVKVALIMPN